MQQAAGASAGSEAPPVVDLDSNSAIKARSMGAHVVAPCAHDGLCPMEVCGRRVEGTGFSIMLGVNSDRPLSCQPNLPLPPLQGRRMWCHFGQRLERPGFVQAVLPGGRGHQDELFSYVVLRRGPRQRVRRG